MKYKILVDYGMEGHKFENGEYDTPQAAILEILSDPCGYDRKVVGIVDFAEIIK